MNVSIPCITLFPELSALGIDIREHIFTISHPPASATETTDMTYQQVHDFTAAGASRFATFLYDYGKPGLNVDAYRLDCLGAAETVLNAKPDWTVSGAALAWTLSEAASQDGRQHTFNLEYDDIIVETVTIGAQP